MSTPRFFTLPSQPALSKKVHDFFANRDCRTGDGIASLHETSPQDLGQLFWTFGRSYRSLVVHDVKGLQYLVAAH